jgi:hypothetical protein
MGNDYLESVVVDWKKIVKWFLRDWVEGRGLELSNSEQRVFEPKFEAGSPRTCSRYGTIISICSLKIYLNSIIIQFKDFDTIFGI